MCISSLVEGKRPMKDRVPQRGCQGSAFPASCTGGRGGSCWQWELTLQTLLVGTEVCWGHCKKSFILETVLWDSRAALRYRGERVSGVLAEMSPGRIRSLWLLFLEQSKTIEKEAPPCCSLSCCFASFCALRNRLRDGLRIPPRWKKLTFLAF